MTEESALLDLVQLQLESDKLFRELKTFADTNQPDDYHQYNVESINAHDMRILPFLILHRTSSLTTINQGSSLSSNEPSGSSQSTNPAVNTTLKSLEQRVNQLEERQKNGKATFLKILGDEWANSNLNPEPMVLSKELTPLVFQASNQCPNLILSISIYRSYRHDLHSRDQLFEINEETTLLELIRRLDCALDRAHQYCQKFGSFAPPTSLKELEARLTLLERASAIQDGIVMIEGVRYELNANDQALQFRSLPLRLQCPYTISHIGGACTHYLTIDNIRKWHPYDAEIDDNVTPIISNEPVKEVWRARKRRRRCQICENDVAIWLACGDRLAPFNPCWQCDECYRLMHYDEEGSLVYSDYQLFPYHHDI